MHDALDAARDGARHVFTLANLKGSGDVVSGGVVVATLLNWLPHATAILSFLWICIRIYETRTVQRLLGRPPQ